MVKLSEVDMLSSVTFYTNRK